MNQNSMHLILFSVIKSTEQNAESESASREVDVANGQDDVPTGPMPDLAPREDQHTFSTKKFYGSVSQRKKRVPSRFFE
jgi:hypothetical protein